MAVVHHRKRRGHPTVILRVLLVLLSCVALMTLQPSSLEFHYDAPLTGDKRKAIRAHAMEFQIQNPHNVTLRDGCQPTNIHLSPHTDVDPISQNTSMTVSFTLDYKRCRSGAPTIHFGQVGNSAYTRMAKIPEPIQFRFVSYIQKFESSWIYHVVLDHLLAGSVDYWYTIQSSNEPPSRKKNTRTFNFATPPLPSEPVRVALVADWGGTADAVQTMQGMLERTNLEKDPLSAVVIAGDISYADSHLPSWEEWFTKMEPLFRSTPLIVAAGNHEIECDRKTFDIFKPYESYFRNPNRLGSAQIDPSSNHGVLACTHPTDLMTHFLYGNSFYGYRHGMLQVIVLNSYTNITKGSIQYNWAKQKLQSIDRKITPWLLVVFHCPFHTTFRGHNNEHNPTIMMQHMEPLFVKYKVNLVLSGHNHAYVRSYSMIQDKVDLSGRGPIYLTVGTGGGSHSRGPINSLPEPWVASRDNIEYGFAELHVVNISHAYFERKLNRGEHADLDAKDAAWFLNKWE